MKKTIAIALATTALAAPALAESGLTEFRIVADLSRRKIAPKRNNPRIRSI